MRALGTPVGLRGSAIGLVRPALPAPPPAPAPSSAEPVTRRERPDGLTLRSMLLASADARLRSGEVGLAAPVDEGPKSKPGGLTLCVRRWRPPRGTEPGASGLGATRGTERELERLCPVPKPVPVVDSEPKDQVEVGGSAPGRAEGGETGGGIGSGKSVGRGMPGMGLGEPDEMDVERGRPRTGGRDDAAEGEVDMEREGTATGGEEEEEAAGSAMLGVVVRALCCQRTNEVSTELDQATGAAARVHDGACGRGGRRSPRPRRSLSSAGGGVRRLKSELVQRWSSPTGAARVEWLGSAARGSVR